MSNAIGEICDPDNNGDDPDMPWMALSVRFPFSDPIDQSRHSKINKTLTKTYFFDYDFISRPFPFCFT